MKDKKKKQLRARKVKQRRKIKETEKKKAAMVQSLLKRKAKLEKKLAHAQGETTVKNPNTITPTLRPKPKIIKTWKTVQSLGKPATPSKSKSFFVSFFHILATLQNVQRNRKVRVRNKISLETRIFISGIHFPSGKKLLK